MILSFKIKQADTSSSVNVQNVRPPSSSQSILAASQLSLFLTFRLHLSVLYINHAIIVAANAVLIEVTSALCLRPEDIGEYLESACI